MFARVHRKSVFWPQAGCTFDLIAFFISSSPLPTDPLVSNTGTYSGSNDAENPTNVVKPGSGDSGKEAAQPTTPCVSSRLAQDSQKEQRSAVWTRAVPLAYIREATVNDIRWKTRPVRRILV